jgi:DNA-binding IclR family transcriptional regulator
MATQLAIRQHSPRHVEAVERAIELLRLVAAEGDRGLSVTVAAGQLGVDKSTVSRLMSTLAAGGLVALDEQTRRYHIGATAFVLGSRFWGAAMGQPLRPILRELSGRVQCTAQIGTLQDRHVLYLVVVEGSARLRVVASPGDRSLAHASAMGKAILACMREAEREAVLALLVEPGGKLPARGPGTIRDVDAFREELARIARRGYSLTDQESTAGISAAAVAVHSVPDQPLAISVTFPASQYMRTAERLQVVEELRAAAAKIEAIFTGSVLPRNRLGRTGREDGAAGKLSMPT